MFNDFGQPKEKKNLHNRNEYAIGIITKANYKLNTHYSYILRSTHSFPFF